MLGRIDVDNRMITMTLIDDADDDGDGNYDENDDANDEKAGSSDE